MPKTMTGWSSEERHTDRIASLEQITLIGIKTVVVIEKYDHGHDQHQPFGELDQAKIVDICEKWTHAWDLGTERL